MGGQLRAASAAPYRRGWQQLQEICSSSLQRLGVEVRLNTRVDRKYVEQEKPYALVIASGAQPVRPQIPGVNDMYVFTARDVLEGHSYGGRLRAGGGRRLFRGPDR